MDNMQDMQNVNMGLMGSGVNPMMGNGVNPMMTGILNGKLILSEAVTVIVSVIAAQMPVQSVAADQPQTVPVSEAPVENLPETAPVQDDQQVAADESTADDVVEGSGGGDVPAPAATSFFSSLPSFQSLFSRRIFNSRQSRQFFSQCIDRITMPCIVEGIQSSCTLRLSTLLNCLPFSTDFIAAGMGNVPDCTPIHCGNSLCEPGVLPCRVESTVTPFGLGIRFGDGLDKGSPEDNIGACLRFNQVNCV